MNTRDIGREKAFEALREMGLDPELTAGSGVTLLTACTVLFIQGWTHGLKDAARLRREHGPHSLAESDARIEAGFRDLKRILNQSTLPVKVAPKSAE